MGLLVKALIACFVLASDAIPQEKRQSTTASAICSNYNGQYKLSSISAPSKGSGTIPVGSTPWTLVVNDTPSSYRQNITGFGAAITDATVVNWNKMSSSQQTSLMNILMTPSGANFSLMRHTIGSSDMSLTNWTYNDNSNMVDASMANFTLTANGTAAASLLAKMRTSQPNLVLLGSSWSAPGWMKHNGQQTGSSVNNNLRDKYLDSTETDYSYAFAQYFVKYIQAFEKAGAHVNAITLQNEPLNSVPDFPTMYVYDYESAWLIQNRLGPAFASAGLPTEIWAYDHNTDQPTYPQTVLNVAGKYVNTVAWHCYSGTTGWDVMTSFHANNTNVKQYMTECWTPSSGSWYNAAAFTMGPLQNWGSGSMAWTLASDINNGPHLPNGCTDCAGLVTINSGGTYTLNTAYYMMAQFSKYMPRGAKVVPVVGGGTTASGQFVQSVATVNPDGTKTVVILSTVSTSVFLRLNLSSGPIWSGTIPAQSVVTWVLPKS